MKPKKLHEISQIVKYEIRTTQKHLIIVEWDNEELF
jgi:hypothetical protein